MHPFPSTRTLCSERELKVEIIDILADALIDIILQALKFNSTRFYTIELYLSFLPRQVKIRKIGNYQAIYTICLLYTSRCV